MDDVELGAVAVTLGTSEQADADLRLILRLGGADMGEDVVVMPGDDPPSTSSGLISEGQ
ncbi:hypothetical protein ACFYXC_14450 [Streptomyces sp. NPDC002701]|uniref:hypothetical protein n=1 Tax=Streptomyces sp. NPDC002701 TaxID=3364661 RepID=UPI0036A5E250